MMTMDAAKNSNSPIIAPQLELKYITNGEEFKIMAECISQMRSHKTDKAIMHEEIRQLANSLKVCFKIDCTIAVIDDVGSLGFYGFNIYPSVARMTQVVEELGHNHFSEIRRLWQTNPKWHIDIDAKMLYDISNKLTPAEIVTLLLYCIEQIIFDYDTPIRIAYTIAKYRSKMNIMSRFMAEAPRLREIYMIPFMIGCSYINLVYADEARREQMLANSMVGSNVESYNRYSSAVQKILFRYGRGEIIDQSLYDIERRIVFMLNWIYEGLNDLRHSSLRVKENLRRHMVACRSPYIRMIFKNVILGLSKPSDLQSDHVMKLKITAESTYINPDMKAMLEKMDDDFWKRYIATMENRLIENYMDRNGNMKKITNEELDMIRAEADSIESVDDKIYLLEKLYNVIGAISTAKDLLNSKQARKVRQTKNELENLSSYAEEVRQYIIKYKIPPKGYGLYIKYPGGYEG
jgi:hypothetical protein